VILPGDDPLEVRADLLERGEIDGHHELRLARAAVELRLRRLRG
jgi:hypothetical protein